MRDGTWCDPGTCAICDAWTAQARKELEEFGALAVRPPHDPEVLTRRDLFWCALGAAMAAHALADYSLIMALTLLVFTTAASWLVLGACNWIDRTLKRRTPTDGSPHV